MRTFGSPSRFDETDALTRHGGDIHALARRHRRKLPDLIDFSGVTHDFARPVTSRLFRETPYPFEQYPDMRCQDVRSAIAAHEGVDAGCVLAGNGAGELIWLAMDALAPRKVLFVGPVFSEYVRYCLARDVAYEIASPSPEQDFAFAPAAMRAVWDSTADLAVACAPNNPAGNTYPCMQEIFGVLRVSRVLVDTGFREFSWGEAAYDSGAWKALNTCAPAGTTVFTLSDMGNFFACPGLGLAYLVGEETHMRRMGKDRPLWTVSPYAQAMGVTLLRAIEPYREALFTSRAQGERMAMELRRMACFEPDLVFTGASFIAAKLAGNVSPSTAVETLLQQGFVIRDCDGIPGMAPGYVRIQVRPDKEAERLLDALRWYAERGWG